MSKKAFAKKVDQETQKIADKYKTTIYAPQKTFKPHTQETKQGGRPYGGVAPKGMTNAQYAELEKKVGNASQMSKKAFAKKVDQETQKIADKYKTTIYAPQKTFKPHTQETKQGDRPYGGVAPKGMTNAQYAELEKKVGNASQMSKKAFAKKVDQETQKIADKYKTTIYAPHKTFKPHK
ncbi:hypothetical protein, partial [Staphylococcus capitis]|uniref:hypothetical protein n=1 Tax=Staphylococcus capitis TaxID=29388 RepID=UPI001F5485ED